ncbi:MAG: aspartate dehydrogenase [Rhizobiaceae bacterium]
MHLGLIGYGNISCALVGILAREHAGVTKFTVLSPREAGRTPGVALAADPAGRAQAVGTVAELIEAGPDLVIECAGHAAVRSHATAVLRAGIETVIVSVGALADDALYAELVRAAQAGGTRFVLPAGAIGGIDLLSALRASGITSVIYNGRKPPMAWIGTPAEDLVDLATLTAEAVFFSGTAREAALRYPKNANVAATLALAGIGWEQTQVRLIADPAVTRNVHEYTVVAGAAEYSMRIEGLPSPDNPKTSITTAYSVVREVMNRMGAVVI